MYSNFHLDGLTTVEDVSETSFLYMEIQ